MRKLILLLIMLFTGSITLSQTATKPMILPFQDPPGASTWLFGQAYGNTTGAYNFGSQWYSAGQGLHFGLDFPALCGTPLVAVADGIVAFVDNFGFGSRPHNLILRHPDLGVTTLYGHLQQRANLVEGQPVQQGQLIGYSGDPDETCDSRPHLHLEVRSMDYRTAYNPVDYIDANWHSLALIGTYSRPMFQQNLDNARQWMSIDDQPPVQFGGRILNNYVAANPLPYGLRPPSNPPLLRNTDPLSDGATATLRQIGYDQCCRDFWFDPSSGDTLYTIDGAPGQRAVIFTWSAESGGLTGQAGTAPSPVTSPDGTHRIQLINGQAQITNTGDNSVIFVPTENTMPALSPDNQHLVWTRQSSVVTPGQQQPPVQIFYSTLDGNNITTIPADPGTSARWLDPTRLLLTVNERPNTRLEIFDIESQQRFSLGTWFRMRGLSVAPGGGQVLFYLTSQENPADSGVYVLQTEQGAVAEQLPWFGAWQWRDANSVYYVPFNPASETQQLRYYHLPTGDDVALSDPATQPFTIMNGKWEVSSDGRHIAFHNTLDRNLWLMSIDAGT